ncbi:MAG: TerC family protein [Phycisphaeraceae bacterium]|nr:TerC family protein [Phycisphaeraceae bacterium]
MIEWTQFCLAILPALESEWTQLGLAFLSLSALEIVLGVDNVVFIAVLTGRLPEEDRPFARRIGLALAALARIVLLFAITWVITLEATQVIEGWDYSYKDVIMLVGGLFLLGKATWEIHHSLEGDTHHATDEGGPNKAAVATAGFAGVITQVVLLDVVFSIDSVLTAVGMVEPNEYPGEFWKPLVTMIAAIVVAIIVMLTFVGPISRFVERHPTMKMLALSFLLLIGIVLIAEGLHQHIPRGYIYFAMGFSLFVELLNLKIIARRRRKKAAEAVPPAA